MQQGVHGRAGAAAHHQIFCSTAWCVLQAYYVFSIGNIKPMITFEYPNCWKYHHQGGTKPLVQSPEYTQICGEAKAPSLCCSTETCTHRLQRSDALLVTYA